MDLQALVDQFGGLTCIMSVEKKPNGGYGVIRIEVGNAAYRKSFLDAGGRTSPEFIPGQDYQKYIPKDLNFEDFVYRAAVQKKSMHAYVHTEKFGVWFNETAIPVESDNPNIGYCLYTLEFSVEKDSDLMTNHSAKITADVLKICVKLRDAKDFRKAMGGVIDDIRVLCAASYGCVLLTDFKERTCSILCESVRPETGQPTASTFLNDKFIDYAASWMDVMNGSNCLLIKDEQDMEFIKSRNPEWYNSLQQSDIHSLVLFPLLNNSEIIGFMWMTNFDVNESVRIKETLELATFFLSADIANFQLMKQLEVLSTVDLLTGVSNRNAMNNMVTDFTSGIVPTPNTYGVVFADVNGLKTMNDQEGHAAGDMLLKRAALVLMDSFREYVVYRAGGDEFVVIVQNMDREELEARVERLRQESEKPGNVSFALGLWFETQGGDVRDSMRLADENMYKNKKLYYERHPKQKQR